MKNLLRILIPITLLVVVYLFYREGLLAVNSKDSKTTIFMVDRGSSLQKIIKDLHKEDLIRSEMIFYLYVKKNGIDRKLQAGDFRLSRSMTTPDIAQTLTKGSLDVWVTTLEGWRKEEVAQVLAEKVGVPATEFISQSREGYLFPDTYLMPKQVSVETAIAIFDRNFNNKFTPEIKSAVLKKGLTELEAITLASLVEREARLHDDRVEVASIILKRLKNDWPLQIDATVQYAVGYQDKTRTWWKKDLTRLDLDTDSPYNTYTNQGLPPGPIGNPSLSSIKAVAEANVNTPYWFYISDTKGVNMHFARTLEEHNANIRKYLGK